MSSSSSVHRIVIRTSSSVPKPFIAFSRICASKSRRSDRSAMRSCFRAPSVFSLTSDCAGHPGRTPRTSSRSRCGCSPGAECRGVAHARHLGEQVLGDRADVTLVQRLGEVVQDLLDGGASRKAPRCLRCRRYLNVERRANRDRETFRSVRGLREGRDASASRARFQAVALGKQRRIVGDRVERVRARGLSPRERARHRNRARTYPW